MPRGGSNGGLELYNTLTRRLEPFRPRRPGQVKIFTCGPSVYRSPHLGNWRTFLFEDVLVRYLGLLGHQVERVINFTDVEDKSIAEAAAKGLSVAEATAPVERQFREEAALLRMHLPDYIPRSSTSVPEAVEIIQALLDKGVAYWDQGDVFFDPLKYEGFGRLFGLDMSRWPKKTVRYRQDTYPGQRWNLGDFILWHGRKEGDLLYWETPLGQGRPSWNIQDPAIIHQTLGDEIDMVCGGEDNLYRHHDYNLAILESFSGRELAPWWLHGAHLVIDGAKMSKSRGNIVYLSDLAARGYSPSEVRFFLIYGRHRKRLNLTDRALEKARQRRDRFAHAVEQVVRQGSRRAADASDALELVEAMRRAYFHHMNRDLDVAGAFDAVEPPLLKLAELAEASGLSLTSRGRARQVLADINAVWQVLP